MRRKALTGYQEYFVYASNEIKGNIENISKSNNI